MDELKREPAGKTKKEGQSNEKVEQHVKKVVNGPVKLKQKSKLQKFAENFIVEDIKSVLSWAAMDVVIPALKKLFVEFVDNTANSIVYGRDSGYQRGRSSTGNISYQSYYDRQKPRQDNYPVRTNEIYSYGTVEVSTRAEAENVLNTMDDYISRYRMVTVGTFLEMVGITPRQTDFNYGWMSIRSAEILRMRDGSYQIKLPKVMPLD